MLRLLRRPGLPALSGALLLLLIVGCGGDDDDADPLAGYFDQLESSRSAMLIRRDEVEAEFLGAAGEEATDQQVVDAFRVALEDYRAVYALHGTAVADLEVPDEAAAAQERYLEAARNTAGLFESVGATIADTDDAGTVNEASSTLDASLPAMHEEMTAACVELQNLADASGIETNLRCNES